jgi:hypothetical protein
MSSDSEEDQTPRPLTGTERFDTTAVDAIALEPDDVIDDDPEERFANPVKYFENLDRLEEEIVNQSSLKAFENEAISNYDLNILTPSIPSLRSVVTKSDEDLRALCQKTSNTRSAKVVIHLLRCRNILFGVYNNCNKLIEANFGNSFNFLRIQKGRNNVAELASYDFASVKRLAEDFDKALLNFLNGTLLFKRLGSASSTTTTSSIQEPFRFSKDGGETLAVQALEGINASCNSCLKTLGIWDMQMMKQALECRWYTASMALDLAIVSYCGAHCEPFGQYLKNTPTSFNIPGPFGGFPPQIVLRPRKFQCLDKFFKGESVWVFHPSSRSISDEPLYLSTTIQDFCNTWGPAWSVTKNGSLTQAYDVGGGSIVPWTEPETGQRVLGSETMCHWIPYEATSSVALSTPLYFKQTLLIGARVQLETNEDCPTTPADLETRFRNAHSLHHFRTTESSYHVDSRSPNIGFQGYGVGLGAQITYKRRHGQSLKAALLERWSHDLDGSRMIMNLRKGYGLELSGCSLNARRTTLWNLIRSEDMVDYLMSLEWESTNCRDRFRLILQTESVLELDDMCKGKPRWQRQIRKAILDSLLVLAECSVTNGELSIPWIREGNPHTITILKRDLSWGGFLQDTRSTAVFGLMVNTCLGFDQREGRYCGRQSGKPVLETSIRINQDIDDNWMRLRERADGTFFWSISGITRQGRFPLGRQGNLTVLRVVRRKALLTNWRSPSAWTTFTNRLLFRNGRLHHNEFIAERLMAEKWNNRGHEHPLPVFLVSKHRLPGNRPRRTRSGPSPRRPGPAIRGGQPARRQRTPTRIQPIIIPERPRSRSAAKSARNAPPPTPPAEPSPPARRRRRRSLRRDDAPGRSRPPTAGPSQPVTLPRGRSAARAQADAGGDYTGPWEWDINYQQYRCHRYTGGELDYTQWSRVHPPDGG